VVIAFEQQLRAGADMHQLGNLGVKRQDALGERLEARSLHPDCAIIVLLTQLSVEQIVGAHCHFGDAGEHLQQSGVPVVMRTLCC
jgi:hypothetical protein